MKKFYVLALSCVLALGAASAQQRFETKRNSDKKVSLAEKYTLNRKATSVPKVFRVKADDLQPVWRPVTQTEYMYMDGEWLEAGMISFKYDGAGNVLEESWEDEGVMNHVVYTYDANNMILSRLATTTENGVIQNESKRTYVYDPIVKDFYTERMGYDWVDGDWAQNFYCEKNEVTRNADNRIVETVKSLLLGSEFMPAYRSVWGYNGEGVASEHFYYSYDAYSETPGWVLYDNLSYKDIVWDRTNGQMVDGIDELVEGDNRVKQYSVYYDGELDGHCFVEYKDAESNDYLKKSTYIDPTVVGMTEQLETIDENGSLRLTTTEYFDEEGMPTDEPSYVMEETVTLDQHGNIVMAVAMETFEGITEMISGEKYDYQYDENGNPTEVLLSIFDYESEEYIPESRTVYGEYRNVAGIRSVSSDANVKYFVADGVLYVQAAGLTGASVYNVQGVCVASVSGTDAVAIDMQSLPAGVYVARVAGVSAVVRFVR